MNVDEYRALLKKRKSRIPIDSARLPFSLEECLRVHEEKQTAPAPLVRIRRPVPRGRRIAMFCLPLGLCQPQDAHRHRAGWAMSGTRKVILERWLRPQWLALPRLRIPLPLNVSAMPQVLCVRYSSVEPDVYADWGKQVVDCLQIPTKRAGKLVDGLGLIRKDWPSECEQHQWWEPAPVNEGFCVFEVWTG